MTAECFDYSNRNTKALSVLLETVTLYWNPSPRKYLCQILKCMQTILSSQIMNVQPSLTWISRWEGFQNAEGTTQNSFCHQGSLWQGKTEMAWQKRNQTSQYSLKSGYIISTYPAMHYTTRLSPNQTDYSFSCSVVKLIPVLPTWTEHTESTLFLFSSRFCRDRTDVLFWNFPYNVLLM